jgi:hypothetical protein
MRSKIEVEAGKKNDTEIDGGGSSHISQNSVIAHFGLGIAAKIDKITIYWTGGNKQTLTDVAANQLITIIEIPAKKSKSNYLLVFLSAGLVFITIFLINFKKRKKNNGTTPADRQAGRT